MSKEDDTVWLNERTPERCYAARGPNGRGMYLTREEYLALRAEGATDLTPDEPGHS
jgi:hypothetical protein